MTTIPLTVDRQPSDLSTAVSAAVGAITAWATTGRFRLCNVDDNAPIYIAIQLAAPDGSAPGIPIGIGEWYPEYLDFQPAADGGNRVWAWAGRDGTKASAVW